jgi:hypothetical protein
MQFAEFRDAVNLIFVRDYAADIDDLGLEEASMGGAWEQKFSPHEYVKWIADKFDLTTICEFKANLVSELSDSLFKQRA